MKRTATAMEVRRKFGEILEGVYYKNDEVVIERHGKVMGVMISEAEYMILEQSRRRLQAAVADVRSSFGGASQRDVERLADEAVAASRTTITRKPASKKLSA